MPAENLFLSIVDFNATQLLRRVLAAISVRTLTTFYYCVISRDDHFKEDDSKSSMISALSMYLRR